MKYCVSFFISVSSPTDLSENNHDSDSMASPLSTDGMTYMQFHGQFSILATQIVAFGLLLYNC